MSSFLLDLRFAARVLLKNRGFTAIAIGTLALGIAATTAIFSVVYGVLLSPLPYPQPDKIVRVWETASDGHHMNFADPNFEDVRDQNHSLQAIAEYAAMLQSVSGGQQPTRTMVALASRGFFDVLGVQPVIGRAFAPEDHRFGAPAVALVRYGYWRQYLGGNTDLASLRLSIDNHPVSVVGILPAGFDFPEASEIWIPREIYERYPSRTAHNWHVVARLANGVTPAQAAADLSSIGARIREQFGGGKYMIAGAAVVPLRESLTGSVRPVLLLLLGAVTFLLLIACANVANLMLAQGAARQRELAVRAALGAERGRLIRQFLTEALLLSSISGALGILAAVWGVNGLLALNRDPLPNTQAIGINFPVLLFAMAICVSLAVLLGVICAVRATRGDLQSILAEGARLTGTASGNRLGRILVTAQLAAALLLLAGAGLLGRSLLRVLSTDPGFHTQHVLTLNVALPDLPNDAAKPQRITFFNTLIERIRALPGVQQAGGVDALPLSTSNADGMFVVVNPSDPAPKTLDDFGKLFANKERTGEADYCVAGDGYFETLGIPLISGRLFDGRDTASAPQVALISQSLAQAKWPNQDPLGQQLEFGNMDGDPTFLTVVGVVGDVRYESLEQPPHPTIYVNYRQRPQRATNFNVVLRVAGDPAALIRPVQQIVRDLDPTIPPKAATFSQVFSASLESRRFTMLLMSIFSATALILAMAGIYGVISYSVARRTREFGVRIALGAAPAQVLGLVFREGMRPVLLGIAIGIVGGLFLARTMQSLLFGISSADPLTFTAVAAALIAVAAAACYLPARRATRTDPLVALRYE